MQVTIPRQPRRIVSLSASATQMLYAIGAGPQVVAVDKYSTHPASAPRTNLSGLQPNIEAIASYRPDLLATDSDPGGLARSMGALHVPVLILPAAKDLAATYAQIVQLGRATNHLGQARSVVGGMRTRIAAIVASAPKVNPPLRVYHELDQTYYSATSATFIGQIYKMFGLANVADTAGLTRNRGYPQLSSELIVSADPQLIFLADTVCCRQSALTVARRPGWSRIAAVRRGEVIGVDDALASEWGPRIVDFIALVADDIRQAESAYTSPSP
jgi:iron complex transport system substrate-binding protein